MQYGDMRSGRRIPLHAEGKAANKLVNHLIDDVPLLASADANLDQSSHVLHVIFACEPRHMPTQNNVGSELIVLSMRTYVVSATCVWFFGSPE